MRMLRHLFTTRFALRRHFPPDVLTSIESTIRDCELQHSGEIRFAIETALDVWSLIRGESARETAICAFSDLGVWDTAGNNGVLIYLLLADRDVEIVADRGYEGRVSDDQWQTVCHGIEQAFRDDRFEDGSINAVREVSALIARFFPPVPDDANELPDRPFVS